MNLRVIKTYTGTWHIPQPLWNSVYSPHRAAYCGYACYAYGTEDKVAKSTRGICKKCLKIWRKEQKEGQ